MDLVRNPDGSVTVRCGTERVTIHPPEPAGDPAPADDPLDLSGGGGVSALVALGSGAGSLRHLIADGALRLLPWEPGETLRLMVPAAGRTAVAPLQRQLAEVGFGEAELHLWLRAPDG